MKNGTLITKENQEEIIQLVVGKVFETTIRKEHLSLLVMF